MIFKVVAFLIMIFATLNHDQAFPLPILIFF